MLLQDLFKYYLGANYDYNEFLKECFKNANLYDFGENEREPIGFIPNNGELYLKVKLPNGEYEYLNLEKVYDKSYFDGGNIIPKNLDAINEAIETIKKHSIYRIYKRRSNSLKITINSVEYDAVFVNKVGEELELVINTRKGILYIKYDYQNNMFEANFNIDWFEFSEIKIKSQYIPEEIKKFINNGGTMHDFKTKEKNIEVIESDGNNKKKYFYNLR